MNAGGNYARRGSLNRRRLSSLAWVAILSEVVAGACWAGPEGESTFVAGRRLYEAGQFEAALSKFDAAARSDPTEARYFHWLRLTYGRLAVAASWLVAARYAASAGEAFEAAVELDPSDEEAARGLLEFYRRAPSFVGGGKDKANKYESALRRRGISTAEPGGRHDYESPGRR